MTPADQVRKVAMTPSLQYAYVPDGVLITEGKDKYLFDADTRAALEDCAAAWEREQVLQLGLNWKEHYNNDQQK